MNLQVVMVSQQNFKHFSKEVTLFLLDVFDSWGKLDTMGVTSRTGISMMFYIKNGDCKKDIAKL